MPGPSPHSIRHLPLLLALFAAIPAATVFSADAAPGDGYTRIGRIAPRHARDVKSSNWAVGAETMGRDYTIYKNWRKYLGPLGVKKARIQSGWAKTEKVKGECDWAWLDEIILDMVDQGVEPWVCLCYGNPIYEGGGGTGLGGGFPASPEAVAAWDAFVGAFVDRYKEHVHLWEIWNEPHGGSKKNAEKYARFAVRTAEIIRKRQPDAKLIYAAGGAFDVKFVKNLLTWMRDKGKLSLVNEITYHPYAYNPDSSYKRVEELRRVVRSFSDSITLRQGENGVPSKAGSFGAVSKYDWNERRQAKWATRRLLADLGRDIPSSYFAICDMAYLVPKGSRKDADWRQDPDKLEILINSKGLLAANPDKTVDHVKEAYYAVQNIAALFDDTLTRIEDFDATVTGGSEKSTYSIFGYRADGGEPVVTLWRDSDPPGKRPEMEDVSVRIPGTFTDPVWIDLVSGEVYDIDDSLWKQEGDSCVFTRVPVHDAVVVIAERGAVAKKVVRK